MPMKHYFEAMLKGGITIDTILTDLADALVLRWQESENIEEKTYYNTVANRIYEARNKINLVQK